LWSTAQWIDFNVWNPRFLAAMMSSGSALQMSGFGFSALWSRTKRLMAAWSNALLISYCSPKGGNTSPLCVGGHIPFADLELGSITPEPCSQKVCC
jgi:hypothetical protein